jgi:tetratricopeptide (TPR) repeat protein
MTMPPLRRLLPLAVVAVTFAVFIPGLQGEFLNYDDDTNFLTNPHYRGLGLANLRWMFTDYSTGLYIPLTWMTLGLDYLLWGMKPLGYHVTSLVFHALNAFLWFLVLRELLRLAKPQSDPSARDWIAAAGTLFFALHPLRVESVAWVTERRDVTSGAFFLVAILMYLRWTQARKPVWLCASIAAFAAMVLSKPMAMGLPLVLLVIDAFPLRRFASEKPRTLLLEKVPYVAFLIAAILLTRMGLRRAEALYTTDTYPFVQSLAQPGYRISFYVLKTLVPWPLSPLYWFRQEIGTAQILGWIATLAATAAAVIGRRKWPAATAAWIAYGVLIAPVSGIVQAGAHFAGDRYSYLACLPFAALGAAALLRASESRFVRPAASAAVAILLGLALLTANQCLIWRDSIRLWTHALRFDPDLYLAYNNRGTAKSERGDWTGAVQDYDRSIAIYSQWPKPWFNRGVARAVHGDHAGAIEDFTRAVQLDPKHVDAIAARAISRSKRGDAVGALADCEEVIRIRPGSSQGYATRGQVRVARGDLPGAIADYTRAIEIEPTPDVYRNRGLARAQSGKLPEALADYTRSLELRPSHVDTLRRRAVIRGMMGDFDGAIRDCTDAILLKPDDPEVYVHRGMARMERKDVTGAAQDFEKALAVAPPGWNQRARIEQMLRDLRSK